jgi:hypothetical protein
MATKVECKTCSKCLWEGLGEEASNCLPSLPGATTSHLTEEARQRHWPRIERRKELSTECNLQMCAYVYINIYLYVTRHI